MFFILSVQRKDISTNLTASLHYRILQVRKIKLISYYVIFSKSHSTQLIWYWLYIFIKQQLQRSCRIIQRHNAENCNIVIIHGLFTLCVITFFLCMFTTIHAMSHFWVKCSMIIFLFSLDRYHYVEKCVITTTYFPSAYMLQIN